MGAGPTARFDERFSRPGAVAADWDQISGILERAELYWVTTVRRDGRPHGTPLVGVWFGDRFYFCSGPDEQKVHNLAVNDQISVTTGVNTWQCGCDVVIEGTSQRVTDQAELTRIAKTYFDKYGDAWAFEPSEGGFGTGDDFALVYRVTPRKVFAFEKDPHGQTRFDF
jgi:nitroimidazol reductase NimA-like FMN-containing flavoprotein (pyridoxamine 5'-phosphate oxidase superfamily)